jgi:hypothetical protein
VAICGFILNDHLFASFVESKDKVENKMIPTCGPKGVGSHSVAASLSKVSFHHCSQVDCCFGVRICFVCFVLWFLLLHYIVVVILCFVACFSSSSFHLPILSSLFPPFLPGCWLLCPSIVWVPLWPWCSA